ARKERQRDDDLVAPSEPRRHHGRLCRLGRFARNLHERLVGGLVQGDDGVASDGDVAAGRVLVEHQPFPFGGYDNLAYALCAWIDSKLSADTSKRGKAGSALRRVPTSRTRSSTKRGRA